MPHPIASARYGERVVEVYPYRPHPAIYDGTCYYVEVDRVRVGGLHVELDDAKKVAEEYVGVALRWEAHDARAPMLDFGGAG